METGAALVVKLNRGGRIIFYDKMTLNLDHYERIHASMKLVAMKISEDIICSYNERVEANDDGKCGHTCNDADCQHQCDGVDCMYEMKLNTTYKGLGNSKARLTNLLFKCEAILYSSGYYATIEGRCLKNNNSKLKIHVIKMTEKEYEKNIGGPVEDLD